MNKTNASKILYYVLETPPNTLESNQVMLDRSWLNEGDIIFYRGCPIKISHKGTSYRKGTWYQLEGFMAFKVGDVFTDKLETNEKNIDCNITVNININLFPNRDILN